MIGLPRQFSGKESVCQAGNMGLIPGLGRFPGERNGNPLQYSCWEIPWTEKPEVNWYIYYLICHLLWIAPSHQPHLKMAHFPNKPLPEGSCHKFKPASLCTVSLSILIYTLLEELPLIFREEYFKKKKKKKEEHVINPWQKIAGKAQQQQKRW